MAYAVRIILALLAGLLMGAFFTIFGMRPPEKVVCPDLPGRRLLSSAWSESEIRCNYLPAASAYGKKLLRLNAPRSTTQE